MTQIISHLIAAVLHALLVHGCSEALAMIIDIVAPAIWPIARLGISLLMGVVLVEIPVSLAARRKRSTADIKAPDQASADDAE